MQNSHSEYPFDLVDVAEVKNKKNKYLYNNKITK